MKIKVSEATNTQLDWMVEFALLTDRIPNAQQRFAIASRNRRILEVGYSTNWSQGGPLIAREEICICVCTWNSPWIGKWNATCNLNGSVDEYGPTPLIAAMKAYVASKLGDEVGVPEELT